MVAISAAQGPKQDHPNIGTDAMFQRAFDALSGMGPGRPLPRTSAGPKALTAARPYQIQLAADTHSRFRLRVLLRRAQLGAGKRWRRQACLAEVRVWPGQGSSFPARHAGAEATRSLRQIGRFIRDATADSSLSPVHRSRRHEFTSRRKPWRV